MVFADLEYPEHYGDIHDRLVNYIQSNFEKVQSGHQGDSWIWIFSGDEKVAIDTFSSMKHQVKCENRNSRLVEEVLTVLAKNYNLNIYDKPETEPHEDFK